MHRMAIFCALALLNCGSSPSVKQCETLQATVYTAAEASNLPDACTTDADCTMVEASITYSGKTCIYSCGDAVPAASASAYLDYWAHDSKVVVACKNYVTAGCSPGPVPDCTAVEPSCVSGKCVNGLTDLSRNGQGKPTATIAAN